MRKDFGIYLYSLLLCIALIYFRGNHKGYAEIISDWRGVSCQYSSNKLVCNYYNGCNSKWLRAQNWREILQKIEDGETVTFAIDYYALTSITRPLVPIEVLQKADSIIRKGGIYKYRIKK